MLFPAVLLAHLLLTVAAKGGGGHGGGKSCPGRGYCAQWVNLSSNPHATYSYLTGTWSCTYGQTAVGLPDRNNRTSPTNRDRTACDHECGEEKPWKCDCVSEADADDGLSLFWMWKFAIFPSAGLALLTCLCALVGYSRQQEGKKDNGTAVIPVAPAPPTHTDLAQRVQGGADAEVQPLQPADAEVQPLQPMQQSVVATPAMGVEQIKPLSLDILDRGKIAQVRIAVPSALAARGLELAQWSQICDEFERFHDANFFARCPAMEGVYWCCPLGPLQFILCLLNPITCIFCICPQEKAKKACLAACNHSLDPIGVAIEIKDSMTGISVHWASSQPSTVATTASKSSPVDPAPAADKGATASTTATTASNSSPLDLGSPADTDESRSQSPFNVFGCPAMFATIGCIWLVVWALIVAFRDNDYWTGCEGTRRLHDRILFLFRPTSHIAPTPSTPMPTFGSKPIANVHEPQDVNGSATLCLRYTWYGNRNQWRFKKRRCSSDAGSLWCHHHGLVVLHVTLP
eukprot:SAG31_NODE_732_length_12494_cov_3.395482_3_plen_517_part_00